VHKETRKLSLLGRGYVVASFPTQKKRATVNDIKAMIIRILYQAPQAFINLTGCLSCNKQN